MPSTMLSTTSPVTCTRGCVTLSRPPTAPTAKPSTAFVSACAPTSPPPATSWSRPAAKPATAPNSGPRRSARRTTTTRGMSGATSPMRNAGASVAWATPPPKIVSASMLRTPSTARREVRGDVFHAVTGQEQHLVDLGEIHGGLQRGEREERGATIVDRAHASDGNPAREETTQPGCDHEITCLERAAVSGHVFEANRATWLALDDAGRARSQGMSTHRGRRVREHLDDGRAGTHVHDPSDEAIR